MGECGNALAEIGWMGWTEMVSSTVTALLCVSLRCHGAEAARKRAAVLSFFWQYKKIQQGNSAAYSSDSYPGQICMGDLSVLGMEATRGHPFAVWKFGLPAYLSS